ncbi:DUF2971 domain-containing protein [Dyella acidiphila]|uniref:DUF2971 domain-containing protein n=1 Tax=Dyella acidiphila TaxID=2775866 RepID=A0ABR9GBZ5_9GAMM|nr:DUF2971 domain-containing protein [Dyella acidiphila]MBE1161567.1 DUF2971 domain-containing protein [Dyella acidiphila]
MQRAQDRARQNVAEMIGHILQTLLKSEARVAEQLRRHQRNAFSKLAVLHRLLDEFGPIMKPYHDPVQWAHYAKKHQGPCLGFDVSNELLTQVNYVRSLPPFLDADKLIQGSWRVCSIPNFHIGHMKTNTVPGLI